MNLNQVTLPATELERSIRFYEQLGLRLIVNALPDYARFETPEGEATLSLHRVDTRVDTRPSGPGAIIYFETAQLDARVEELKQLGVSFLSDPVDQRWLWREASLEDPDGNRIILFHAGEHRRHPPWRIN
jgi:catechol 2,3-dioxygenase-like lactoylglutathione lyase family enzyme